MHRQGSVRGPVRRTVLTAAIGLLTAGIAGCGLRLDRDPQLPELSPLDALRDAVARSLAATEIDRAAQADEGAVEAIRAFAEAVGPPWDPPADLADPVAPPNPDPSPFTLHEGLADVAARIVDAARSLGARTDPGFVVLADVAVGALLHLDSLDADSAGVIRADLAEEVREALDGSGTDGEEDHRGVATPTTSAATPAGGQPLADLITACYTSVHAYERAVVHLPVDDTARQSAHARIGRLHAITAVAVALGEDVAVPSDRPAWDLPVRPRDSATAREALRIAEDGLVEALAAAQDVIPPVAFLSWLDDSGRARTRAEGAQDLRFTVVPGSHEEDG